jgi:ferredoxin
VPECPVEAIYAEADLPEGTEQWTDVNREKTESGELVPISEKRDPLPGAEARKTALGF